MPDVTMPQLGETVTEGTITKWFKAVGDQVARDEPLFEVSTDKVDSEVPVAGRRRADRDPGQEGDTVDVGVKLAGDRRRSLCRRRLRPPRLRRACPGVRPRSEPPAASRRAAGPDPAAALLTARRLPRLRTWPPPRPPPPRPTPAHRRPGGLRAEPAPPTSVPRCRRANGGLGPVARSCGSCSTSTASTRPRSPAPASAGASPGATSTGHRRQSTRPRRRRLPPPADLRRCRASPTGRRPRPAATRTTAAAPARRSARPRPAGTGRGRPLHQHPPPHRRAHGPVQGHLRPHPDGQGDRLRAGRAGAAGPRRAVPGRGGLRASPTCPSSPGPRSRRSHEFPHLNASVGDDALIVHHDVNLGYRRRPRQRGAHRAGGAQRRGAQSAGDGPAHPRARRPGPDQAAEPRRHQRGHVLDHQRRAVRHLPHRRRSSTSPRWRSCPPTA